MRQPGSAWMEVAAAAVPTWRVGACGAGEWRGKSSLRWWLLQGKQRRGGRSPGSQLVAVKLEYGLPWVGSWTG